MQPVEVGERVLKGIKNNDLFIFSHPEMKEEVQENFEWVLSFFPKEGFSQERKDFEDMRRKANVEDRKKYDIRG